MLLRKGVDVSEHNGFVDWDELKDAGIEFAIVRSSYGKSGVDDNFRKNVVGATMRGISCGAYHYGYALTPADAITEAENCRRVIDDAGVLLALPVFYDMEDADYYKENNGFNFSKKTCTAICRAFMENIGLNTGLYASYSWLEDYIDWQTLHKDLGIPVWNAQWGKYDDLKGFMWQYTEDLIIGGKRFDGNIMYVAD